MSNVWQNVRELAAKEVEARSLSGYGQGRRRKPVQVSTIPEIDQFAEKSDALAKALNIDGRSLAAIVAVSYMCEVLGISVDRKVEG